MKNKIIISGKKYAIIPEKIYLHKKTNKGYVFFKKHLERTYLFKNSIINSDLNYSLDELFPLIKNFKVKKGCFLLNENESYAYTIEGENLIVCRYPLKRDKQIDYKGYTRVEFNIKNKSIKKDILWMHSKPNKFIKLNTNPPVYEKLMIIKNKHIEEIEYVFFKLLFYLEYGSVEFIDLNNIEKKENKSTAKYNPIPNNITIVDKKWNRQYAEKTTLVKEFMRRQKYGKGRQKEKMVIVSAHSRTYHKNTKKNEE
jgi:hypothetical protein